MKTLLSWSSGKDSAWALHERRMAAAVRDAVDAGFTHIAFGDLHLEDIRRHREARLAGSGLEPLFPLWNHGGTASLAHEMIAAGLEARITCVDSRTLDRSFAGRFDTALLADLQGGVDPCGENGEFHPFAFAGPMFRAAIDVGVGAVIERQGFVFAELLG